MHEMTPSETAAPSSDPKAPREVRIAAIIRRVDDLAQGLSELRGALVMARSTGEARVSVLEGRVATLEGKLDSILTLASHIDGRLKNVEARIVGAGLLGLVAVEGVLAVIHHLTSK